MDRFINLWKKYGMITLLLVLVGAFSLASPKTFFTSKTMYNILRQASVIGVLSCCVTMQLITGGIDLSIASRLAFTQIICAQMLLAGIPIPVVVVFAIAFAAVTGALNAVIAELLQTNMFVVSMASMYIWTGICYLTIGARTLYGLPDSYKVISQTLVFGKVPSIIFVFVASALLAHFILSKTRFGRYIYALGSNREAARLAGINVVKSNITTHAVASSFVGIAAVILLSRTMTAGAGTASATYAFDCITACVLGGVALGGGRGSMGQTVLGVLVINVMFNGLTIIGVSDYWQMVIKGIILFIAIGLELLQRYSNLKASKKINVEKVAT